MSASSSCLLGSAVSLALPSRKSTPESKDAARSPDESSSKWMGGSGAGLMSAVPRVTCGAAVTVVPSPHPATTAEAQRTQIGVNNCASSLFGGKILIGML